MRILQVNADDLGGRFAGLRLSDALSEKGISSDVIVWHKYGTDPKVHHARSGLWRLFHALSACVESALSLQSTLGAYSFDLLVHPLFRKADILHLQLIHSGNFFSLLALPWLTKQRPVVWTLHDPWAMTGHCVHPMTCDRWLIGCGSCPDLDRSLSLRRDNTAMLWHLKQWAYERSKLTLFVASDWMAERVAKSPLLSRFPIVKIPFGVDLRIFHPLDKIIARKNLGINSTARVTIFREPYTPDYYKWLDFVVEALQQMTYSEPVTLLTLGKTGKVPMLENKYVLIEKGWVSEESELAEILAAADIMLMPSLAESFGMMAVEAMACGTPVLAFDGTALSSTIHAPLGGITVPWKDGQALARALEKLLENVKLRQRVGRWGRQIAEREYDFRMYIQRHIELYQDLMNSR